MINRFNTGDSVRIDIPDENDLDHELYHGRVGKLLKKLPVMFLEISGTTYCTESDSRMGR